MPVITAQGGPILTHTAYLSSAQLLALHTTPVEIIPDPGAGRMICFAFVQWFYKFVTTPYDVSLVSSINYGPGDQFGLGTAGLDQAHDACVFDDCWGSFVSVVATAPFVHVPWTINAGGGALSAGDGTVTVVSTYNILTPP